MFKLVLGIVVVGILQFGFVLYSNLQEPVDLALAPVQTESDLPFPEFDSSVAPAFSADDLDEETEPVAGSVALRRSHAKAPAFSNARSIGRRHPTRAIFREPSVGPAVPGDFRTIVISYGGSSASHSARRPCDPPEPERPKQRTAFAKAEPAAIRPWQVITTFDPRIN